jgi:phosphoserine phosphatase
VSPQLSRRALALLPAAIISDAAISPRLETDPLPSWRAGKAKEAILAFLRETTNKTSPDYIPVTERLAVFDNDGTLWPEQPMYTEVMFALDRLQILAFQHTEWHTQEPFRSALARDVTALAKQGLRALGEIVLAIQGGMAPDAFRRLANDWILAARHPQFQRLYTECAYQPMLEAMHLFRAHGFQVGIVSGGTVEFIRAWSDHVYDVQPEQVVGTTLKLQYRLDTTSSELIQLGELDVLDEGPAKPVDIFRRFGRRPVAAFGNSDGDYEMLQFTTFGQGRRLGFLIHHDDAEREFAYDRQTNVGRLDRALNDATRNGWHVVSMRSDWASVFQPT